MSACSRWIKRSLFLISTVLIVVSLAQVALAQTPAFTYQGRLTEGGAPATGQYDIEFRLFATESGGSVLANGTLLINNVQVTGGLFTVKLDYGVNTSTLFDGSPRFIETAVRVSGSGNPFTTLAPRQEVTSTPYAIRAKEATAVTTINGESPSNVATGAQLANAATPVNTSNAIVRRDANGDFAARDLSVRDLNASRQIQLTTDTAQTGNPFQVSVSGDTAAPSGLLARFRYGSPLGDRVRIDQAGGFVALGELGVGAIPATGCGYRMMWYPFKAAFRAGSPGGCPTATTEWDDSNIGFYSWAGGNETKATAFASFAFGDQVKVTAVDGVGFGGSNEVSGTAGFSTGAFNICSGFGCVAMGFTNGATGQGSVAIGYRVGAIGDYNVVLGHRANTAGCTATQCDYKTLASVHSGVFLFGDESTTNHIVSAANNEFAARAAGGFRFRTNATLTTGCNLPAGSGVFSCSSSRTLKENFRPVSGEDLLARLRKIPVNTWNYIAEGRSVRHLGPFAEDFYGQFNLGIDEKNIGLLDIAGVNFAANKALEQRTAELQQKVAEVDRLRAEVTALRTTNASIEQRLAALEHSFKARTRKVRTRTSNRSAQ